MTKRTVIQDETGMFDQNCELTLFQDDVKKYNQNHDARGRFAPSTGGAAGPGNLPPEMMAVNIPMDDDDPGFPEAKPEEKKPVSVYDVTPEEAQALRDYVGPEFAFMNAYSRNPRGPDYEHYEAKSKQLDSLIAKQPPLKGEEIVYRGMRPPKELANQLVKGAIIQDPGFMSTSIDRERAKNFGDTVLTIRVPKGYHAVRVQDYIQGTVAENERELLLPRGTKLKITGVHQVSGGFLGMGKKLSIDARVVTDE